MAALKIDSKTSALVLIDLQKGITARTTAPHSSDTVVKNAARIAERFRTVSATVVLVHVDYLPDLRDMLFPEADAPFRTKDSPPLPKDWAEFVPGGSGLDRETSSSPSANGARSTGPSSTSSFAAGAYGPSSWEGLPRTWEWSLRPATPSSAGTSLSSSRTR